MYFYMSLTDGLHCTVIVLWYLLYYIYQFVSEKRNIVWHLLLDIVELACVTNYFDQSDELVNTKHANVTFENMSEVSSSLDQLALNSWHVGNKMTDRRSPLWHKATHNPNNVDKNSTCVDNGSPRRGQPLAWRSQSICDLQAYRHLDGIVYHSSSRTNCRQIHFYKSLFNTKFNKNVFLGVRTKAIRGKSITTQM